MNKGNRGRTLHRTSAPRKHLIHNQVESLLLHNAIRTTEAKAKETQRGAEKLITRAKRGNLEDFRHVRSTVSAKATSRLMKLIVPAIEKRASGYTRLLKSAMVRKDGSPVVILEFTDKELIRKREAEMKNEAKKSAKKVQKKKKETSHTHSPQA